MNQIFKCKNKLTHLPKKLIVSVVCRSVAFALLIILIIRIAEAKILLRNPDYSVQDVADQLHFSDQSAFGKFFKKQMKISPMEYKKTIYDSTDE